VRLVCFAPGNQFFRFTRSKEGGNPLGSWIPPNGFLCCGAWGSVLNKLPARLMGLLCSGIFGAVTPEQ